MYAIRFLEGTTYPKEILRDAKQFLNIEEIVRHQIAYA